QAAEAAALLVPKHDDRSGANALDGLDPGDHTQGSVEPPSARDGIEMRARPDLPVPQPADQVADAVGLDPEPGLLHPAGGEFVRLLLSCASADAVRADSSADGVELGGPLERPRAPTLP